MEAISKKIIGKKVLVMIQFLYLLKKKTFGQISKYKKLKWIIDILAFKKLKKKLKFYKFIFFSFINF